MCSRIVDFENHDFKTQTGHEPFPQCRQWSARGRVQKFPPSPGTSSTNLHTIRNNKEKNKAYNTLAHSRIRSQSLHGKVIAIFWGCLTRVHNCVIQTNRSTRPIRDMLSAFRTKHESVPDSDLKNVTNMQPILAPSGTCKAHHSITCVPFLRKITSTASILVLTRS